MRLKKWCEHIKVRGIMRRPNERDSHIYMYISTVRFFRTPCNDWNYCPKCKKKNPMKGVEGYGT